MRLKKYLLIPVTSLILILSLVFMPTTSAKRSGLTPKAKANKTSNGSGKANVPVFSRLTTPSNLAVRDPRPDSPAAQDTANVVAAPLQQATFSNTGTIIINGGPEVATPYPSTINVSGVTGTVTKVAVFLDNFSHTFPADVDMALVGPGGQRLLLMSDVGGGTDAVNVDLTFDDAAPALGATALVTGTFSPTNINAAGDGFPSPGPAGPIPDPQLLSVFNGLDPNGTWSLFVVDDSLGDAGSISGGWHLNITSEESVCCDRAPVKAYVVVQGNSTVSVVDTSTNTVTANVTGLAVPRAIAITPNEAFVYVTNFNSVSAIDTATNTVVANVPVGNNPIGIVITPDGHFAYVANNAGTTVTVIDTTTNTVAATLTVGPAPQSIAITPNGALVYVPDAFGNFSIISTATNTVTATIPIGVAAIGMAFTPDGAFLYMADFGGNNVKVLDTATNTVVATITAGSRPFSVEITPDGTIAYVLNLLGNSVSVIDTATNTVTATIPVGSFPRDLAFTPDGAFAYVTNFNDHSISVIDTATNTVTATIALASTAWGIVMTRGKCVDCAKDALYRVIDGPQGQRDDFSGTVGSKFTVGANVLVDKLGFEDQLLNGLASPHLVGLWDSSGTLLASVTVQAGTGSELIGNWRYETLPTPVTLTAGSTYIIAAQVTFGGDKWTDTGHPPNGDGSIDLAINGTFSTGSPPNVFTRSGFSFPTLDGTLFALRWAPANLRFTTCPIPLLIAQVQALVTAGTLTQNQGAGLINKLNEVSTKLEQNQTGAATNQLNAFINQVNAFINNGSLSQTQGQALIDAANAIKAAIACP